MKPRLLLLLFVCVLLGMGAMEPIHFVINGQIKFRASPEPDVVKCALMDGLVKVSELPVNPGGIYTMPVSLRQRRLHLRCQDASGNLSLPANPGAPVSILRVW